MRVHVSTRIAEDVHARIVERALVEERTLSAMIERLVRLGLGTVVTEREVPAQVINRDGAVGQPLGGSPGSTEGSSPPRSPSRSVTAVCSRAHMHRSGEWCKSCGVTP